MYQKAALLFARDIEIPQSEISAHRSRCGSKPTDWIHFGRIIAKYGPAFTNVSLSGFEVGLSETEHTVINCPDRFQGGRLFGSKNAHLL